MISSLPASTPAPADAGMDPAIVIRLFGSKEALFAAVADGAFTLEPPFDGPTDGLGLRIAQHLTSKPEEAAPADGFDEFRLLLRSAASPVAAPILSAALHAGFIGPWPAISTARMRRRGPPS